MVPPTTLVTVGATTAAPVEPADVIEKPQMKVYRPGVAGSVAVAVAAATVPDEALTEMRCEEVSGAADCENAGDASRSRRADARYLSDFNMIPIRWTEWPASCYTLWCMTQEDGSGLQKERRRHGWMA
jgi:hypothetical protein